MERSGDIRDIGKRVLGRGRVWVKGKREGKRGEEKGRWEGRGRGGHRVEK